MAKSKDNRLKYALIAIGVAVLVFIVILVVNSPTTSNPNASDGTVSSSIMHDITSISDDVFNAVGAGTVNSLPKPINGPSISVNGKPQVVYIGAEYCPYCATERWPMAIALSRFGTITGLKTTHSSNTDVYPDTQTFSFHGSSYSSPYLVFSPTEIYSNVPQGNGYAVLDKTTTQEQNLMNTYDAPPYVASSSAGAIPFIYFNGKYLITGATYSPAVLQGKTYSQIAGALSDPSNEITKGVVGAANTITAAICGITNNQPSNVCTTQIQAIEKTFSAQ